MSVLVCYMVELHISGFCMVVPATSSGQKLWNCPPGSTDHQTYGKMTLLAVLIQSDGQTRM